MKAHRAVTSGKPGISADYADPGVYAGCWKLMLKTNSLTLCPRSRKMIGLEAARGLDIQQLLSLMPAKQVKILIHEFNYACAFDTKLEMQIKTNLPDGKIKWFRLTGILYYRRWDSPDQMVGVIEDISQQVNEECLSLAVVNHELRSPLTVIKLNVQLLINILSGNVDKYPVRLLRNVELHINCMTSLMEEYLASPVNDKRQREMNRTVFDLDDLIDIIISEMKLVYPGHRFIKQEGGPVLVKADKYKIVQVFINYLTNAVNFSPQSSQIAIQVSAVEAYVVVSVQDQGIGIPPGQEEQIFQKFYRSDLKSVRQKNSKGLGLYLVKQIIGEHNGAVRAERGKEGGSVFYFSLPVYCEETNKMAARAGQKLYQ
ncbi:ATP-binding protein [Mucilaginibacter sp.]|uniref:ATP-binding protein n=1 Tax=Mucilaginibacter sp. TaxID=1882438 RepID=UPI0035BC8897